MSNYYYNYSCNLSLQASFLEKETEYSNDVLEKLRFVASECWLGCLMALNNPPLQPDWESHVPGMDAWNILPQHIKTSFAM